MTQADLSKAAHVSRRWLSALEAGKATAEFGLVLRVVHALGMALDASLIPKPDIDLDDIINAHRRGPARGDDR